ncbi:cytochrome ubiquinol oxidase subunit I [Novosphingobium sp. KACC 22771]|uniref:cytochrome ubiquinol oxidase subunit I n=1 Tax=Novosphingobium sp. KACC 22771 TaxID=3025670 RepID=UPI002365303E|nr:cytochrome ubiquinol oxidase subunit I [Novosphingobium sp. KACC 22771]WDF70938.1 cytochrome ubiquinol oxidase subunit I [Novosphingobium sp. KACC 22771]
MDPSDLSRLQFALTALYHFLFVPLTLGLSFLLVIMESVWVISGREIWRDITKFWGKLFGINFAMGVATGITMEFQFGTNWSYYSHYVGDIFGAPLAIEGLMAFFLESTFVGLMFFGWDRLSRPVHLLVTFLVAFGSNLSALWILIANGWMQNPVGATFNPDTMRMELGSFSELLFNPVAQAKFVHTVSAGYVVGSVFVLAISAWYMLQGRHLAFARRSFAVAAAFGLASSLSVAVLGDESGFTIAEHQPMKMAAIEGMWHTEEAPASFTALALPSNAKRENIAEIKIPYVLGLIGTHSIDKQLPGIHELVAQTKGKIVSGIATYDALQTYRANRKDAAALAVVKARAGDLGYALLLKHYVDDPRKADAATIDKAAWDTVPNVAPLFWSFRLMVGLGFWFIFLFGAAFWATSQNRFDKIWLLKAAAYSWPLPWIAAELGWIVAEYGRQPWAIAGVLPVHMAASSLAPAKIWFSLAGFVTLYSSLLVIDVILMRRYIRLGPVKALGKDRKPVQDGGLAPQPAE